MDSNLDSNLVASGKSSGPTIKAWYTNEMWPVASLLVGIPLGMAMAYSHIFRRQTGIPITSWWPTRQCVIGVPIVVLAYMLDLRRLSDGERARLRTHMATRYQIAEANMDVMMSDGGVPVIADYVRVDVPVRRLC